LHHEDEELHVFPLLLAQGTPGVAALVARLQHDHLCMTADWVAARLPLQALVDGRQAGFSDADGTAFDRFVSRYDRHIADEEAVAYPAAKGLLAAPALQAMGSEMAARRKAPAR
jgi:hemerythrin-like domain-containing protein